MKKYLILTIVVGVLFYTCAKIAYNPNICFQEDILPIFVNNCAQSGCHNPTDKKAGYDLTNYDGIMQGVKPRYPILSKIYITVKGNNPSMPRNPYSNLSTLQVTLIKVWIDNDAPNSRNCKSCDSTDYTFSNRINPIMQTWCIGCHSGSNVSGGYDFSSYNGVVHSVTNNRLLGCVEHSSGFSAMPKNAGYINSCDIAVIRKWIVTGYPNN